MGTWRTLHRRLILHKTGAISVNGSVSPGEPGTQVLLSRAEWSSDFATACSGRNGEKKIKISNEKVGLVR